MSDDFECRHADDDACDDCAFYECVECDDESWNEHCGDCLCCPESFPSIYQAASAVGIDATDMTHLLSHTDTTPDQINCEATT